MRTRRYALVQHMGDAFPELRKDVERVKAILKDEEESFSRTLEQVIHSVHRVVWCGMVWPPLAVIDRHCPRYQEYTVGTESTLYRTPSSVLGTEGTLYRPP